MYQYKVELTRPNRAKQVCFFWAKNADEAEQKAWNKLNPEDQDWGYCDAKWVVTKV
jgi:hypothetical protein